MKENRNLIEALIDQGQQKMFREFVTFLAAEADKNAFILKNDIILMYYRFCESNCREMLDIEKSSIYGFISRIQEIFFRDQYIVVMHRYQIARYRFYMLRIDGSQMEEIDLSFYLDLKERHVTGTEPALKHLHLDYTSFYDYWPTIKDVKNLGNGIRYLNRYLSSNIFTRAEEWNSKLFEFMKLHRYNEQQLLINGFVFKDFESFFSELETIMEWLYTLPGETPVAELEERLRRSGFEPGWGNCAGGILESMQTFKDLINEPTDLLLEKFLAHTPMPLISRIAIISPHGWFGQENVLGRPDTGGQVIYILDQVRALEKYLKNEMKKYGLDIIPAIIVISRYIPHADGTTCNVKKEKIHGTDNGWILRVPFKDREHKIVDHWISRFHVWPYLEKFAEDSAQAITAELRGRPDLIIGNYSDGNLVASLLSDKLDVAQCTIAHALEKTKYLFSDVYWKGFEDKYNFSLQFIADILAMNKADFIITSTYQEIAGTEDSMGQYESYQFFPMPGLVQVKNGINLYVPKFNVIPPGVDEGMYFPYYEKEQRIANRTAFWEDRLFSRDVEGVYGHLDTPEKMPLFTMARLDKIKNITGLVEAFGMNEFLKNNCNLIVAAGVINREASHDQEEREEIDRMYGLIHHYGLEGKIRWLPSVDKIETGEVYRVIADHRGAFVQPAHFEAFGLTILEAMLSGLPTFGPRFGGPLEIIEDGISGFLLNTSRPDIIAGELEECITAMLADENMWLSISGQGIQRVKQAFTWTLYSERLINLSKIYGFWRYTVSNKERIKMDRYNDLIYHFLFKERAEALMP